MRLTIDHRTVYRFREPQRRLVQMLRMTPENHHDQTVASWRIDVDCDATMRSAHDGFGNATTMLYVAGPIAAIEITVSGEVLTSHSSGVLHGANEVFPPALFLRVTAVTRADPEIAAFADDVAERDATLSALKRVNVGVSADRRQGTVDSAWLGGGVYRGCRLGWLRPLNRRFSGRGPCPGRGGARFAWCRRSRWIEARRGRRRARRRYYRVGKPVTLSRSYGAGRQGPIRALRATASQWDRAPRSADTGSCTPSAAIP